MKIIRYGDKKEKISRMYGHTMYENSNKLFLSPFENVNPPRTSGRIERVEIESTEDLDKIKIVYKDRNKEEVVESSSAFKRNDIELEIEKTILSTYQEVINKRDIKEIKCDDLLMEIKERFKNDIRYAYKILKTKSKRNSRHSVYIYCLYTIIIATMSVFNGIDFKAPVCLSIVKNGSYLTVEIETIVRKNAEIKMQEKVIKAPENETKLLYIEMLCKNNNIENSFKLIDNKYVFKYEFCEIEKEEIKLYSKESEEDDFFQRYMDIFNGREINREEE